MSNKKLTEAFIPGHQGPFFPQSIEKLQKEAYSDSHYKRYPVRHEFLEYYSHEFEMFFSDVKLNDNFVTTDGVVWTAVSFTGLNGVRYRILFPNDRDRHHEDKTVSSHHVALYAFKDDPLSEDTVEQIGQTCFALFRMGMRDFVQNKK